MGVGYGNYMTTLLLLVDLLAFAGLSATLFVMAVERHTANKSRTSRDDPEKMQAKV